MEEVLALLAGTVTLVLPALGQAVRRLRRGPPPIARSVTLDTGAKIDLSAPEQAERKEQIDTILESTSLPTARASRAQESAGAQESLFRRFVAQLNVRITALQIVYGLFMIIGIAAKEIWDYNQKYGHLGFNAKDMAAALLVAPIIYTAVQPHIAPLHESLTLLGIGIAFQNGFFWQSVFATAQAGNG